MSDQGWTNKELQWLWMLFPQCGGKRLSRQDLVMGPQEHAVIYIQIL